MANSNFDSGFSGGVTIRGIPLIQTHPGAVFWVNNSSVFLDNTNGPSNGNRGTFRAPFSTVQKGIDSCLANRGDIVFVMPGHNEGSAAANAEIFDLNVAGVAVIGLGAGSLRPTFDLDVASASIACDSANNLISNIIVRASVTVVVAGIDLTATCDNLILDKIEFQEEAGLGGVDEFIDCIQTFTTDNGNDGLIINECVYVSSSTDNNSFLELRSDAFNISMTNNRIQMGVASESIIGCNTATDTITAFFVANNKIVRLNTVSPLFFEGTADDCTGMFFDNKFAHADDQTAIPIPVGTAIMQHNNLYSEAIDRSGFVLPVIGDDSA